MNLPPNNPSRRQLLAFPGACTSKPRSWRVRPRVSVVLPLYNQADLVAKSVRSVLNHDRYPLELIVVNDGSTDNPERALEEFRSDERLTVITQENGGLAVALNRGFREARGSFWTWTSADNYYLPGTLGQLADYLLDNPAVGLVYANVQLISQSGEELRESSYRRANQARENSSILLLPIQGESLCELNDNFVNSCFLYRRKIGEIVGDYKSEYLGYEDYDYWLRILQIAQIAHHDSDEPMYCYRLHENSLTASLETERLAKEQLRLVERTRLAKAAATTVDCVLLRQQGPDQQVLTNFLAGALRANRISVRIEPFCRPSEP